MGSVDSQIKYLFEPRSVALIGASYKEGKIGYKVIENVSLGGYQGKVYPVNPKPGEMFGHKVYQNMTEIDDIDTIDMAVLTVPVPFVFDAVKSCASKNVKYILIITSGFSEVGNSAHEREIVEYARSKGMRIVGPNIFGIFSPKVSLNASFAGRGIPEGTVALISQSGALGAALVGETFSENLGLSCIVPLGNKSDVDETDLIKYLMDDDTTKVIFIYMEGLKDGEPLIEVLNKATLTKPVIFIKSGSSKRGALAAASHTGSLAGSDEVFSDVMAQCGVHRAETIPEALQWAKFLGSSSLPTGENALIITNGGGVGVMAADACDKFGVHLFDNMQTLHDTFSGLVPDFGSVKNPVDITGQVGIEGYERCIEAAYKHPDIHSIICLGCEHALFDVDELKATILRLHNKYGHSMPIVYVFYGGLRIKKAISELKAIGVSAFDDVYEAISCLGEVYKDYERMRLHEKKQRSLFQKDLIDVKAINLLIDQALKEGRKFLLADEGQGLLNAAGISMPKSSVAKTMEQAIGFAEKIGYPVAMKIVSRDILHKSDAGGVVLNLENQDEVVDAYQAIRLNCHKYDPNAVIKGVEISEMVDIEVETIVGGRRDKIFGPVLMFGAGGIYVEIMKDVVFRSLSFSESVIRRMIKETKFYPLLLGARGQGKRDIDAIVDTIISVAHILKQCERITDIEINPLIAYKEGTGVKAVDIRVLIK